MATMALSTTQPSQKLSYPMSVQQEDAIIHTRITNDEKQLRRVTKKFHNYTSLAYSPIVPPSPAAVTSVEDARDAFLVELASFHLSLKKSLMVCEAEARQVEEYQRERERIENEHHKLKDQIEELKTGLEDAQLQRRRKIEYDGVAERINTLPTRAELEQSIRSLENDMAAIRSEHEDQDRTMQVQKTKLDMITSDLSELRLMGKQDHDQDATEPSRAVTPTTTEAQTIDDSVDVEMSDARTREESGELKEDGEKEEGEENSRESEEEDDIPLSKSRSSTALNPSARAFVPDSRTTSPMLRSSNTPAEQRFRREEGEDDEDIEMGELAEDPKVKVKKLKEDLEEGEASDLSSELSEPPDD